MNVVQVANFVTPTSGGQRRVLLELGARYAGAGHRCTLVTPGRTAPVAGPHVAQAQVPGVVVPWSGGYRMIVRRAPLQRLLLSLRPDVVELSDKTSLWWLPGWLAGHGVRTVLLAHDRHDAMLAATVPTWLPWRPAVASAAARTAQASAAVVCASAYCAEQFAAIQRLVHRVPLGVDLDAFQPLPDAAHRRLRRELLLVFVGRLSAEKQPGAAVATVRELVRRGVDARLEVIGDGPLLRRLEGEAAGLPVVFAGHLAQPAAVAAKVAAANALLAPCETETFGLAVLEALAAGTPVVVPRAGAARELVVPGTGLVVDSNGRAMANAVLRLSGVDRAAQASRCRAHAEGFSWDATAAAMLDLFADVSRARPAARAVAAGRT